MTTTGYQRGCRCKLCVQAASDYARAARERKAEAKAAAAKKPRRRATAEKTGARS